MTDQNERYPGLTGWLRQRGHSDEEIDKILVHVRRYEEQIQTDSVMDSIAAGRFDIAKIIDEALGEPGPG